jgi:hypothetical protein
MGVHEVGVVNVGEGVVNVKGCGHYLRAVPLILVLSTVYTRRELGASANFLATPFISVITSHSGASSSMSPGAGLRMISMNWCLHCCSLWSRSLLFGHALNSPTLTLCVKSVKVLQ